MGILDRVKKLCTDKGISVGDLEKELELSNGSIYKWIKTTPGADKVEKVADYFNVSVDYLLGRTDQKENMPETENTTDQLEEEFPEGVQVLRRATKELTPEARKTMVRLMKAFLDEEK